MSQTIQAEVRFKQLKELEKQIMNRGNILFKLAGETNSITERETSILNLVATTLRELVITSKLQELTSTEYVDIESLKGIATEYADILASEVVRQDKIVNYHSDLEAFTCKVSGNKVFILQHPNIDIAMRYAIENIGEISVIYNDKVIVFGGYIDNIPFWRSQDNSEVYRLQIDNTQADEPQVVCST